MCLGLATGYIKPKKECYSGTNVPLQKEIPPMPEVKKTANNEERYFSLLKTYTYFDNVKDMSIEEFADFIDKEPWCDGNCTEVDECKDCIIDFLKKEAK